MPPRAEKMIEISLPWPPAILSANARVHRFARTAALKAARAEAQALTRQQGFHLVALPDGRLGATLTFHFPDDRRRDADNCLSRMKAVLDGICDALDIDDERLWPITLERGPKVAGGRVVVRIGENHAK